ncbi:MAG: RHS repeat-associated core domain-containing protein [Saprospiraceae bacterium]|nr:RHS repeat-associated core domain-containing protein [Saprospiraceae bacterium]
MTANTATGNKMFDNAYTYDRIGNILSLTNDAVATGPNPIGGKYGHGYTYDLFNRLTTANSYWEYEEGNQDLYTNELTLGYGDMHRISYKNQEQLRDGNIVPEHSYFKDYAYATGRNHIQQITNNGVSSGNYKYDLNGNMRNITEPGLPVSTRYFAWDEANRLKAVRKADALVQHHLYDANGERSHKGISNLFYMGINGGPQGYDHYIGNYQLYPSGYLTVGEYDLVTKHYYTGTQRIASRLAGDVTEFHAAGESGEYGQQTLGLKDRQEDDIKAAFDQLKLSAPAIWNVPGMVPPCNQGEEEDELCACVFQHQCGDGPIYFFHSDHLGSSTFLTDGSGQPYQFFLNLPFGETMEEQFALTPNAWWKTPYLFNGKELDSRTSLYYYGARYYDPGLSVWLSVDPLAEKFPEWSSYIYTVNNPIRYIDPDGKAAVEGPGDPPIGAVIAGTIKAGFLNLLGFVQKYSNTPQGYAMRAAGLSHHFGVYKDNNSPLGVSVGYKLRHGQTVLKDVGNAGFAALDLAPLSPGKGGVATFAKAPGFFGLSNVDDIYRAARGLSVNDRIAQYRQLGSNFAELNDWTKNNKLSKLNDRTIYSDANGMHYSLDTQHGHFEVLNHKGEHKGSIKFDGSDTGKGIQVDHSIRIE